MVNGYHKSHLLVHANVVTVGLELQSSNIVLRPTNGMSAESGMNFLQHIKLVSCYILIYSYLGFNLLYILIQLL